MGTITQKTKFVTDDGAEHNTLQEAQAHNERLELIAEIENEFGDPKYGVSASDIATWILKYFDRKPDL